MGSDYANTVDFKITKILINEKKEEKILDSSVILSKTESIEENNSVIEEYIASKPESNSYIDEKNLEQWDSTTDLTNIEGSDILVPKFISITPTTTCFHNNDSTEDDPWLIRHQEIDGHWDTGIHEGAGTPEIDCAATAAALLSFFAKGYTDRVGKYKKNVKAGLEWLISKQLPNGSWCKNNYVNAICTMCLTEATGLGSANKDTKKKAELAVEFLLSQQNNSGCFDYSGPSYFDNMAVTGWCIMALKSALLAEIKGTETKEVILKCNDFLNLTEGTNDNSSTTKGLAWYQPGLRGTGNPGGCCQAIAMLIRQYAGWERTDPWMEAAATGQSINIPKDFLSIDIHRLFFTQNVLFQQSGKLWKDWLTPISKIFKESQRQDGDFKGSWDNNGSSTDIGGRVLNTALINISFTIHYRHGLFQF